LLKEGKEDEVEARRMTYDNEWWFNNKMRGDSFSLLAGMVLLIIYHRNGDLI